MRRTPDKVYESLPCSYVAVACAYRHFTGEPFEEALPEGLKNSGYLSLDGMNRYLRGYLPVSKKTVYRRGERPALRTFLQKHTGAYIICVTGHYLSASDGGYESFFDNSDDEVICVWEIKGEK